MSKPRNPRYFPKMKVRGARRRRMAPFQRTLRAFDSLFEVGQRAARSILEFDKALRGN